MAVSVTTNKNRLTSNGSTTAFNFTFPLPDSDTTQVKVMLTVGSVDTLQDVSLYTVTATNNDFSSGGTVTFTTAPASGTITIYRDLATTQTSDYVPGGALDADTLEGNLDKLTMLVQEQQDAIDRSIKFPVTDATALTSEIPNSSGRASNTLIFDSSGNVGAGDATTTSVTTGTEGWADTLNSYDQKEWIKLASSVSVTMDATATYSKVNIIYMTTSTNALTVALPAEASSDGRYLAIIKADSGTGTVTINNDGGSAVCAKLTKQYEIAHVICDGTNWFLLNRPHNLGDSSVQPFGEDGEVTLAHDPNKGLILKNDAGTERTYLTFHSGDNAIADGDILGEIDFQAFDDTGVDSDIVSASIGARAEGTFSDSSNATELVFNTGVSEDAGLDTTNGKMILSSAGNLSLTAGGIQFPATFSNETNANTLDDYEEGTWTPDLPDGGGEDSISGRYVKIGRQVIATAFINTNTTADYSNFKLTGLPFTILDDDCCGFASMTSITTYNYDDGSAPRFFYLTKNTDYIQGWSVSGDALEHSGRNNEVYRGNDIMFQAIYETAS